MSLLEVLGAGASFDCVDKEMALDVPSQKRLGVYQPPLTKDLFAPRPPFVSVLERLPRIHSLVPELRRRISLGETLEQQLARVQARADGGDAIAAAQLMSLRFYIRDVIEECGRVWSHSASGATNYVWLVGKLDEWARDRGQSVVYVTFNYDTVLEDAFRSELRQGFNSLDDYLAHPRARLYKPHGSIDWAQQVRRPPPFNGSEREWLINTAATLPDLGPIELRRDWSTGTTGQAWMPALAVPVESKSEFVCPSGHLGQLAADLEPVDRILAIGWRAMEQHFISVLRMGLTTPIEAIVTACGSKDDAQRTAEQMIGTPSRPPNYMNVASKLGFSDLVGHAAIDSLLNA